ncbi:MAG: hypothetical protein J7L45_02905 [Candidatus Aenigmarchaeota archaeon]|nr:hypothetical protein [Candidatus Aenigmarchaeota archaeon]
MFKKTSRNIVANVRIKIDSEDPKWRKLLKKLEGIYPVEKRDDRYVVLFDEDPREDLPRVEAIVDDSFPNLEYVLGVNKMYVTSPFTVPFETDYSPNGHAHVTESGILPRSTILKFPPISRDYVEEMREKSKKWIDRLDKFAEKFGGD